MKLMVGITQEKQVQALFLLWSLKKKLSKSLEFLNINLKLNVKETQRPTSNWTNSKTTGKSKIVQALSLVETFPNIKQQFEIDVDATQVTLISKNNLFFVFQFFEKMSFNTMFETVKTIW